MSVDLDIHYLGRQDYQSTWQAMSEFTDQRGPDDKDQLWILQHSPVFTQGQAGKAEHLLSPGAIPVVQSDRGGQATYHGPGQLIAYPLINLRRRQLSVRNMVSLLEATVVDLLAGFQIDAYPKADAPGVYVVNDGCEAKIASLGLRVRKGCCFHGLSINVAMDLAPFARINPCGYAGLAMTQLSDMPDIESFNYKTIEQSVAELIRNKLALSRATLPN